MKALRQELVDCIWLVLTMAAAAATTGWLTGVDDNLDFTVLMAGSSVLVFLLRKRR